MTGVEMLEVGAIGVGAGFLGGLAGVGGSMLILPALGLILGYPDAKGTQHLYMAAAITTNLVVALPASLRHARAGAVRVDLLRVIIPAMVVALVVGVLLSNRLAGWELVLALAGFQLSYCGWSLWQVGHRRPDFQPGQERATVSRLVGSAGGSGLVAGVLGLGGGVLLVPVLQVACRVRLRQAIGTSSAVICLTVGVGAAVKLMTLGQHGQVWSEGLMLAGIMSPGAVVGAWVGASATHRLSLPVVRVLIVVLLGTSAVVLIRQGGRSAGWW
jgi:uncharacterized membrane protein YfcA